MALSTSERQARYRNRLKEAALANTGGTVLLDPAIPFAGTLGDAPSKSLLLPLSEHAAATFIVIGEGETKTAFSLGPDFTYHAFTCDQNDYHKGLVIPDVRIVVDVVSAFDPGEAGTLLGAVWRRGDTIGFYGLVKDRGFTDTREIFWNGAPYDGRVRSVVAYSRWQLVVQRGNEEVVIQQVDVSTGK
jgi:hypothetical protein